MSQSTQHMENEFRVMFSLSGIVNLARHIREGDSERNHRKTL